MPNEFARIRMKLLVIGLGQIGYSNASYFTSKGIEVHGYDISQAAIKKAIDDGVIVKQSSSFENYDVYVICVSTHNPKNIFEPSLDALLEVASKIKLNNQKKLVCIDSTIAPGSIDRLATAIGLDNHLVHCPHRWYAADVVNHGVNQTRVIGGYAACCLEKGLEFYTYFLGIETHAVSSIRIAAACKLVENSYRYIQIAFVEELKMFCYLQDMDFEELRTAVNTKWNIKLLEAKDGIGKHCLPKDSEMFRSMLIASQNGSDDSIIAAAKSVDRRYREFIKTK